jgi:hypothetical protein
MHTRTATTGGPERCQDPLRARGLYARQVVLVWALVAGRLDSRSVRRGGGTGASRPRFASLLAGVALNGSASLLVAQVTVITVLLSVILHGLTAGPIGAAFARSAAAGREDETSEPEAAISTVAAGK